MNFKTIIFVATLVVSFNQNAVAQSSNKTVTTSFWVAGICGRCEETIEKAMDTKGVVAADYDLDKNRLTVTYKTKKISEEKLHQILNDIGYDTEKSTATEEQYSRVHGCCKYREQEKH